MISELPTRTDLPSYKYSIELSGVNFFLEFTFNQRMDKWIISLLDENENYIHSGVPVVVGIGLFDQYTYNSFPEGSLFAFDTSNNLRDPERFDLGGRVRIYYDDLRG